ncbi:glycosyltransferase [bacterium]|nr:glycosyltransferase [bacterium]NIN92424.1 glycosyltransferase [bacterium]NIO18538.1 glycosyltransferase [bacterium]NIO73534.1 glycosyltransferase [bacterium]
MKVSGFTFVKDAIRFSFPIVESIKSILPICDEFIVNVGKSDDGTFDLVRSIGSGKIKIIESKWDPSFKYKGRILAQQTNIALAKCTGDWCFYLQADEVVHEKDLDRILKSMQQELGQERVEGLIFNWIHFYGDYSTFINSYHWYQREVRIIRNFRGITSWSSAQGFRLNGRKLKVKDTGASIYHYGWVRSPEVMAEKKRYHDSLHHGNGWEKKYKKEEFDYLKHIDPAMLNRYNGSHPKVMEDRIGKREGEFNTSKSTHILTFKDIRNRISDFIARKTGWKIGEYKNFILIE